MALLNSAASIRPRSSAGTISPPGSGFTAAPISVNMSTARPTVRNFRPFMSSTLAIGFLNQPKRLRRHRAVQVRDHVHVDGLVDLFEQRLAAAVVVPGEHHVRVHAEGRARAPQRQRRVLAVVVGHHAVAAVERALVDRLEQLERRHHRAGGQHLDLQAAAGHVVDLLGEVVGVLVEDVLRRPGALEAQAGGLRAWTTIGAASAPARGGAGGGVLQESAALRRALALLAHRCLLARVVDLGTRSRRGRGAASSARIEPSEALRQAG